MAVSNPTGGTGPLVKVLHFPAPGNCTVVSMKPATFVLDYSSRGDERPSPGAVALRRAYKRVLQADPCCFCGARRGGTIDHVVAKARGGLNAWSNMSGSCWRCNHAKGNAGMLEFLLTGRGSSTRIGGKS